MNKKELSQLLTQLKAQSNGADATSMMIALVRYASPTEMTADAVALACNISRRTVFRKETFSFKPCQLDSATQCQPVTADSATQCQPVTAGTEGFPLKNPLSKNISSLRSDINTSPVGTHTREAGADADALREKIRKGFSDFMRIYPRQIRGSVSAKAQTAYKELIESGRSPEDIEDLVWAHAHTEEWTKENGRFVPNADKFLNRILNPEEEQSEKSASGAPEGSGYIQVPLDDRGAFSNVAESSVEARFLKAYGRWYKNLYAFNLAWANAKKDIDPELLVYCAEIARDKARERDGDTQYIRLPEEWLRDGRYEDYRKDAEYKKRTSGTNQAFYDAFNV